MYSDETKTKVLLEYQNGSSPLRLAHKYGMAVMSIYKWINQNKIDPMYLKDLQEERETFSTNAFYKVVETATMNEAELIEYCIKSNLNPDDIKKWRSNCMNANLSDPQKEIEELKRENQRLRALEKEKDKKIRMLEKENADASSAAITMGALFSALKKQCAAEGIPVDEIIGK